MRFVAGAILLASLALPVVAEDDAGVQFFESKVRPVLVENCYKVVRQPKLAWEHGWERGPAEPEVIDWVWPNRLRCGSYASFSGTLTGFGFWQGAVISFKPDPASGAFQVGFGANGKNTGFGATGWWDWTVVHQPASGNLASQTIVANINLDLICCQPSTIGDFVWQDLNQNGIQDFAFNKEQALLIAKTIKETATKLEKPKTS